MITPEERIVAIETRLDTVIQDVKESRVNIHAIRNQTNDITSKFYERIANLVISLIVLGVLLKK